MKTTYTILVPFFLIENIRKIFNKFESVEFEEECQGVFYYIKFRANKSEIKELLKECDQYKIGDFNMKLTKEKIK